MSNQSFSVIPGKASAKLLSSSHGKIIEVVKNTYLQHHRQETNNPDSYFLNFSDKPEARIIALPAAISGKTSISGLKWIASYPKNIQSNLQRASATMILNDYETGYPIACLEASQISAFRTAASAVLAANLLNTKNSAEKITFIGTGIIARTILDFFKAEKWNINHICTYDLNSQDAEEFSRYASKEHNYESSTAPTLNEALMDANIVILATTAAAPYIQSQNGLSPGQIILNISLRDIAPEVILDSTNIFDDVEHCMKANTSPHLAEQMSGNRDFVGGTLAEVITNEIIPDTSKPIIFSPFGLGVLDIAVAKFIYDEAIQSGWDHRVDDFFPNTSRW